MTGFGILGSYCEDVKFAILSRLPHNSLCRFKCVSRDWYRLISNDAFLRFYYNFRRKTSRDGTVPIISGIFVQDRSAAIRLTPLEREFLSLDDEAGDVPDPSLEFLREEGEVGNIIMEGSCNGLLLCHKKVGQQLTYHICNPLTKQRLKLPQSPTSQDRVMVGLDFDPSCSFHYKVARIFTTNQIRTIKIEVFTSETGSWREFKATHPSIYNPTCLPRMIIFMNDALFWPSGSQFLLMYHLKEEYLKSIRLPYTTFGSVRSYWKSEGHLYYCRSNEYGIQILVLLIDDNKFQDGGFEWQLMLNVDTDTLAHKNLDVLTAIGLTPLDNPSALIVEAFMFDSKLGILILNLLNNVVCYDLATGRLKVVKDFRFKDWWFHMYFPYKHSSALFGTSSYSIKGN